VESLAEITTAVPEQQQQQQQQRAVVVVEVNSLVDFPALRPQDNSNNTSPPDAAGQRVLLAVSWVRIQFLLLCGSGFGFSLFMLIPILLLPGLHCERSRPSTALF
jgi:hypothetical protein